ncbi:MAG: hypothetical protein LBF71_02710 [Campylobacteraceae bacterium]|jgi:hypothetical protein|nr:hypothetical protein [Campylobacteraceae bacterium]
MKDIYKVLGEAYKAKIREAELAGRGYDEIVIEACNLFAMFELLDDEQKEMISRRVLGEVRDYGFYTVFE